MSPFVSVGRVTGAASRPLGVGRKEACCVDGSACELLWFCGCLDVDRRSCCHSCGFGCWEEPPTTCWMAPCPNGLSGPHPTLSEVVIFSRWQAFHMISLMELFSADTPSYNTKCCL